MAAVIRIFQAVLFALASALVGGFVAVVLVIAITEGPFVLIEAPWAIFGILFLGLFGAAYATVIATLPAMLLGGLLCGLHIHHRGIWAAVGAAAGVGCYAAAILLLGDLGDVVRNLSAPRPVLLAPAFALAGVIAALFFRMLADLFADFDELDVVEGA